MTHPFAGHIKDGAHEIARLETQVQCRVSGRIYDFKLVRVDNGLILRGQARSYYAKQLAQQAVLEATPMRIIANEIQVSEP